MANRIILKTSKDERGNEKTVHEWIKDYLRLNGDKRFGEIKQFLSDHGIKYASDKGFDLALKSMIERGDIGKRKKSSNPFLQPYPVYYLIIKKLDHIATIAQQFDDRLLKSPKELVKLPRQKEETDEQYFLRNLIYAYGIYVLFVLIKGWKFTSDKNSRSLNSDILSTWLKYVLTSNLDSFFLEEGITELVGSKGKDAVDIEDSYKLYANKKKWNKLLELDDLFKKMYPLHYGFYEELLQRPVEKLMTFTELKKILKNDVRKNPMSQKEVEKIAKELGFTGSRMNYFYDQKRLRKNNWNMGITEDQ